MTSSSSFLKLDAAGKASYECQRRLKPRTLFKQDNFRALDPEADPYLAPDAGRHARFTERAKASVHVDRMVQTGYIGNTSNREHG